MYVKFFIKLKFMVRKFIDSFLENSIKLKLNEFYFTLMFDFN